ncbi:MAG TPA: GNAT family N-acetyltransferase [Acidimicrobiales bacterium]|nr:GNAT family N-acetyltransferase [Acidimicrobiales bacterium]
MIRAYRASDLERLYEICVRTGDAGEDAYDLVTDKKLYGHIWAAPYGVIEPEHAFVLDGEDGLAAGYVLGALDSRAFEARCEADWWPPLRAQYLQGSGSGLDAMLIGLLHNPPIAHDKILVNYPSHLHIDLLPSVQGAGNGAKLMDALLESLRADGSVGVHFGVSAKNTRALGFYEHLGFEELHVNAFGHTLGKRL